MESVLEKLAMDTAGKAVVGIIPQSERELFGTFGVRAIPAMFILHNSEVKQSYVGFQDKDLLAGHLKQYGK
jgi:thioredoxin-like negative regulator of GroEL